MWVKKKNPVPNRYRSTHGGFKDVKQRVSAKFSISHERQHVVPLPAVRLPVVAAGVHLEPGANVEVKQVYT